MDSCSRLVGGCRGCDESSLRELADPSQVLFGSDCPFASEFIVDVMVKGLQSFDGLETGELAAIEWDNAAGMFPECSR